MSWRSIVISNPAKLTLFNQQLCIKQRESIINIPLEDIAIILIESKEVVITSPLLSALAQNNVTLLTCDKYFLPCGQWLSFSQHYQNLKIIDAQIKLSKVIKNRLCQKIIKQKVINQSLVLKYLGKNEYSKILEDLSKKVLSADKSKIEGFAANIYFKSLFGKNFNRRDSNICNQYLNYGYTIIRSAIARSLCQYGFLPTLGIFHHNMLNAFNLADDLIEPFRPLVDLLVYSKYINDELSLELKSDEKIALISLLNFTIKLNKKNFSVLNSIEKTISSLQSSIIKNDTSLLFLPEIIPLTKYTYE